MKHAAIVLTMLALMLSGCANRKVITNNGIVVYEEHWNNAVQSLSGRAQIELGCTQPELTYTLISRQGRIPTQVLVDGCSHRALYSRRARDRDAWTRLDAPAPALNVNTNVNVIVEQHAQ